VARVALDADIVIAFLDAGDDQHARAVDLLRPRIAAGEEIAIGASAHAEVMVRPLASGTGGKVDEFIDAIGATVLAIDRELARRAASLRARHPSLRLPDALSLATVLMAGADLVTLDQRLRRAARNEQEAEWSSVAPPRARPRLRA
jgi:predicted nucleic acid-binding protein